MGRHKELVAEVTSKLNALSQVGAKARINPETGLQEFSVECADEGGCRQDYITTDPIDTVVHRFVYDGSGNLAPNQPHVTTLNSTRYTGPSTRSGGQGGSGGGPRILGQIIPPDEESATGTVLMPVEGYFINLSEGVYPAIRNPQFMSDEVLLWARREISKQGLQEIYTKGIPMTFVEGLLDGVQSGLGGGPGMVWDSIENNRAHMISPIVQEINRRVNEGTWSLGVER